MENNQSQSNNHTESVNAAAVANEDEIEIDLGGLFFALLHRVWIIIIVTIIGGILGFLVTALAITPIYSSSSMIYINTDTSSDLSGIFNNLQASAALTKDYETIISSRPVVSQVIEDLKLNMTYAELTSKITATNPTDTHILSITVTDKDPYQAQSIVDDLTDVMIKKTSDIMEATEPSIIQKGEVSQAPDSPSKKKNAAAGAAVGFLLSVIALSVLFIKNDTVKTQEDVEKYLGMSILGEIPLDEDAETERKKHRSHKKISYRKIIRQNKKKEDS